MVKNMTTNTQITNIDINAPYDVGDFQFQSEQKTILDYINLVGDFNLLCNPFPSGEKPVLIKGSKLYFITYNFYSSFGFVKNKAKLAVLPQEEIKPTQIDLKFETSWDTNTISVDARDIVRNKYPASILTDKLAPQLKNLKLTQFEPQCWGNIKSFITTEDLDISSLGTSLEDIVVENKVPQFTFAIKKLISDKVLYFKKLKLDWCSFNGIPSQDLIVFVTPDILDALSLNNNLIYSNNDNIRKSSEQLFPVINGVKIVSSTNHKDYCGTDILIATNWSCVSMIADINARVYLKEGTAKDYCLNAQFIGDGFCKFYDIKSKKSPTLIGVNLKFKTKP